jgi:hypothetical protein
MQPTAQAVGARRKGWNSPEGAKERIVQSRNWAGSFPSCPSRKPRIERSRFKRPQRQCCDNAASKKMASRRRCLRLGDTSSEGAKECSPRRKPWERDARRK